MKPALLSASVKTLITIGITWVLAAQPLMAVRPTVIKATPDNGDKDVDPTLRRITIEFDQDMDVRYGYSICGGGDQYPKLTGPPRWASKRRLFITVRLQPNHDYAFSINCLAALKFRNVVGEPAIPYPITFSTGAGKPGDAGKEQAEPDQLTSDQNKAAIQALREKIDQRYSYRDRLGLDWDKLFNDHRRLLLNAKTPKRFAQIAGVMLAQTRDMHIWLTVDGEIVPGFSNPVAPNANAQLLPNLVPGWRQHSDIVYSGMFDDGTGYLRIDSWTPRGQRDYEGAFRFLGEHLDAPGFVIDVRFNNGGGELWARDLAGCFVDEPAVYAKNITRDPIADGGFTPVHERVLEPNPGRPNYKGRVAVLSGPRVLSSCEAFVLMMKQAPNANVFGATTRGASGNPMPYDLGNGVTVLLPSWKAMLPDGTEFEGVGIEPDVRVDAKRSDFAERDPVLDAALKHLRK